MIKLRHYFLLLFSCIAATMQSATDYAQVLAGADWGWQNCGDVAYGKATFTDLYGNPQRISIAKYSDVLVNTSLYVKEHSTMGTNGLAYEAGATAAINGSYFNMTTCTSTTALWQGGVQIATTSSEEFARCNGVVAFKDGTFDILPYGSSTTSAQLATWGSTYDSFVVCGPILRRNGVSQDANIGGEGFYGPHPRTMLGKTADGTVYMIVAEGRIDNFVGMSLANLVSLAEDLGMTDAINLDGGGSSTLWVAEAGIVNTLSGGAVRNVPNVIVATSASHVHSYTNGFCTCDIAPYEPARQDSEGYYEIDNGGKLFWLARLVNNGGGSADARLTSDINLENRLWQPMGSNLGKHSGEFDGQGHSIKGLRIESDASVLFSGFIGYHTGTKDVHDFHIAGSLKTSGTTMDNFAAGVVAYATGNHRIEDVWSSVDITNTSTEKVSARMAGIVVEAETCTINRCTYDGTISGAATNLQVAGILGWPNANGTSVTNCLFAGTLTSTGIATNSAYLGGIVGYGSGRSNLNISNNLSIGTISSPKSATRTGALVGNNASDTSCYENNFILEGQPVSGSSTATAKMPTAFTVTTDELTDGSLPAKLDADNWTQGAKYPVPQDNEGVLTDEDLTVDGIKYEITGTNTAAVTYPNTAQPSASNPCTYSGEVTIPATVTIRGKAYNVTAVGDYAFHFAPVTALLLPEGITKLGYKAIYQTQLTSIVVPNSVTLMDYEALGYNKQLESITFGENIAANTWGDKLCIYGAKKYEVYMNCDAVPTLRSYTFDFTGANVHVRPSMYEAFKADAAWSKYDIIGDLWKAYSFSDLQSLLNDYLPKLPAGDAIGTDPGQYSESSVEAFNEALSFAQTLDETATLEQLNNAINGILTSYEALYCYPLGEGFYSIESVAYPGYYLWGDEANASRMGLRASPVEELQAVPYFKLVRQGGGWLMQCVPDGMYVGTVIGTNSTGKPISLTSNATHEQLITWQQSGCFKIQGTETYPYSFTGSRLGVYNYTAGSSFEKRQLWRFHPAATSTFAMDFDLENERVRGFVHDFEYTKDDASRVKTYNVSPPERRDWPMPVEVFWGRDTLAEAQQILWSESPDMADAEVRDVATDAASFQIYNLIPRRTYYCKIQVTKGESTEELASFSFRTAGQLRHLKAEGTANVRDLGGWKTESGKRVCYGKLFRGGEWNGGHNLEPEGIEALTAAGIKAELDLRSDSEAKSITRSPLGNTVTYKRTALGQTASHMEGLTNSKDTYKTALQFVLSCVRSGKPTYFHCAIGRDRTGTLAFLIEGVLGMSKSDIYKDYELTNFSYWNTPCLKSQLDAMFEKVESYSGNTLEEKFAAYLTAEFGITSTAIKAFREKMLYLDDDDATGIDNWTMEQSGNEEFVKLPNGEIVKLSNGDIVKWTNGEIYDLGGRKLSGSEMRHLPKGKVLIVGGKKIVKKI